MNQPRRLSLPQDVPILVPAGPGSMTAFVLEEQQDWFEEELPFLRRLVRPGWTCVDVGASYGCYALSLAAVAGPTGRVIACEPHPRMHGLLAASAKLAAPGGAPIELHALAVADREGRGSLSDPKDPELAELLPDATQDVPVATLDRLLAGRSPELVKIDVEGGGHAVLAGATRMLKDASPVVQFVIRHAGMVQVRSTDLLMRQGYLIYRLLPGPGVLSPIVPGEHLDGTGINAFAIRPDREPELRERGLIIAVMQERELSVDGVKVQDVLDRIAAEPWIAPWKPQWMANAIMPGWEAQRRAVALAACAAHEPWGADRRVAALRLGLGAAREALSQAVTGSRLFTLARIAQALGNRSEAMRAIDQLLGAITAPGAKVADAFREPFLPPLPLHEGLRYPGFADFLLGAALEAAAYLSTFSAYFLPPGRSQLFDRIAALPVRSPRSDRTIQLLAARTVQKPIIRL